MSIIYMVLTDCIAEQVGHKYWFRRMYGREEDVILRRKHQWINVQCSELVIIENADGLNIIKDRHYGSRTISQEDFIWIKLSSTELAE